MKINLSEFIDLLQQKEDELTNKITYSSVDLLNSFKDELFTDIEDASYIDEYISTIANNFSELYLNSDFVFKYRKTVFKDKLNEILNENDETGISNVKELDDLLVHTGYRYLLDIGYSLEDELLATYCLRDVKKVLLAKLNEDTMLDTSEYCDFNTKNELVEDFFNQIVDMAKSSNDIINIDGYSNDLCNEFFGLDM